MEKANLLICIMYHKGMLLFARNFFVFFYPSRLYRYTLIQCCGSVEYFIRIWIRGSLILNYVSGSRRQINYGSGSGSFLDIFVVIEQIFCRILSKPLKMIKYWTFFLKLLRIAINSKDPGLGGQLITDSQDLDPDPQHCFYWTILVTSSYLEGVR